MEKTQNTGIIVKPKTKKDGNKIAQLVKNHPYLFAIKKCGNFLFPEMPENYEQCEKLIAGDFAEASINAKLQWL